ASLSNLSFEKVEEYNVPFEIQGMNDLAKIGSYYYLTVYQNGSGEITPKIVRVKDLNQLIEGYEDLCEVMNLKGVPYFFSFIEERFFLTEIDTYSAIKSFKVDDDDRIYDLHVHFDIGIPDEVSIRRREIR